MLNPAQQGQVIGTLSVSSGPTTEPTTRLVFPSASSSTSAASSESLISTTSSGSTISSSSLSTSGSTLVHSASMTSSSTSSLTSSTSTIATATASTYTTSVNNPSTTESSTTETTTFTPPVSTSTVQTLSSSSGTATGPPTTSTTTSTVTTATGPLDYHIIVTCYGTGLNCSYGGSITWPNNSCTDGCYDTIVGGFTGNLDYAIALPACQDAVQWSFEPETWVPVTLLVEIQASDGTVVQAEYSTMYSSSDSIANSYLSCSPVTPTSTTTVTFASTTTTSSTTYLYHVGVELSFYLSNKTECGTTVNCTFALEDSVDNSTGSCITFCLQMTSSFNQTAGVIFNDCTDYLLYSYTMNTPPGFARMTFDILDQDGTVLLEQSSSSGSQTLSGRWSPPCQASTSSSMAPSAMTGGLSGPGLVVVGVIACTIGLVTREFEDSHLLQFHQNRRFKSRRPS
jgi:hypothetical protein